MESDSGISRIPSIYPSLHGAAPIQLQLLRRLVVAHGPPVRVTRLGCRIWFRTYAGGLVPSVLLWEILNPNLPPKPEPLTLAPSMLLHASEL